MLPNVTEAKVVTKANARAPRLFFEQRASDKTDAPIDRLAILLLRSRRKLASHLFGDHQVVRTPRGAKWHPPRTAKCDHEHGSPGVAIMSASSNETGISLGRRWQTILPAGTLSCLRGAVPPRRMPRGWRYWIRVMPGNSKAEQMVGATYSRVSNPSDKREASIESQEEASVRLLESEGVTVPPEYRFRERYTGMESIYDRPILGRIEDLAASGKIRAVGVLRHRPACPRSQRTDDRRERLPQGWCEATFRAPSITRRRGCGRDGALYEGLRLGPWSGIRSEIAAFGGKQKL